MGVGEIKPTVMNEICIQITISVLVGDVSKDQIMNK